MNRKMAPRLIAGVAFLIAAVFYLLSELLPAQFGGFNLAWAGVLFAGASGLALLLSAVWSKGPVTIKKVQLALSCLLLLVAVGCLVAALVIPENLILPIVLVVIAFFVVIGLLAVGAKKWDEGDNQKEGYKNYYRRKAEEDEGKRIEKRSDSPRDEEQ